MQGLKTVQQDAAVWEAQAQDNLQQISQLKSLLEESAFWGTEDNAKVEDNTAQQPEVQQKPQGSCCTQALTPASCQHQSLIIWYSMSVCTHC